MKIYGDRQSGNCLKVLYTANRLNLDYTWVEVDIANGGSRTPTFLALSPQGQVPIIELATGQVLAQSNAIIRYLAHGTYLLPTDAFEAAKVDEALFWEQYSHEPYIAVSRFQMLYEGRSANERDAWRVERGESALDYMNSHLSTREFWTDAGFSVADIALLAYTRLAPEGGFDLATRPNLVEWIARCESELAIEPG